ncbi:response regulator [Clostridium intestinale]|uniref:response regulator n=1 Tax=Clostridium intestinale TaxID=36845 RepID=UPI0028EB303C|nr:response regulator [Clostridium intestinale]
MRILLIEDDDVKADNIKEYLQEINTESSIVRKCSWQSGLIEIISNSNYKMIVLDMSMPRYDHDSYEFETYAGWDVLKEMKRRNIKIPTTVVTSFDTFGKPEDMRNIEELNDILWNEFPEFYLGIIRYNSSLVNWKNKLGELFGGIEE